MGHSQPSRLSKTTIDTIKDLAVKAIRSVGINMGPAHVEMIVTAQGPKMVELGARMGGGLYHDASCTSFNGNRYGKGNY